MHVLYHLCILLKVGHQPPYWRNKKKMTTPISRTLILFTAGNVGSEYLRMYAFHNVSAQRLPIIRSLKSTWRYHLLLASNWHNPYEMSLTSNWIFHNKYVSNFSRRPQRSHFGVASAHVQTENTSLLITSLRNFRRNPAMTSWVMGYFPRNSRVLRHLTIYNLGKYPRSNP